MPEIQAAAKKISDEIESELLKMQKRHLSIDEKLADNELNNIQKAEFLIEDCSDRGVNFFEDDKNKILEFAKNTEPRSLFLIWKLSKNRGTATVTTSQI